MTGAAGEVRGVADGGRNSDGISKFTDKEIEAQRGDVTGPGPHRLSVPGQPAQNPGLKSQKSVLSIRPALC